MKQKALILLGLFVFAIASAEAAFTPGTVGPAFLRIGVGARPSGMGEAFAAGSDDVTCVPWNPSGLGLVDYTQITFMHMAFLADTTYEAVSLAQPVGVGAVAGSFMFLNVPQFDNTNGIEASVTSGDFAATVSYGTKLGYLYPMGSWMDQMLVGGSLKMVGLYISGVSAYDYLAMDLGGSYKTSLQGVNVGMSLLNLGAPITQSSTASMLPVALRLGVAYEWDSGIDVVDLIQYLDETTYLNCGVEWWWERMVALRAGYKIGGPPLGAFNGLTLGVGFQYESYRIDYAYIPYGDLGVTQRISATMAFGELEVGSGKLGALDDLYSQGLIYYDQGLLEPAIETWKKILQIKPKLKKVQRWISTAESELKEEQKSDEISQRVAAGDQLFQSGKYVEAILEWKKAKELNPKLLSVDRRIANADNYLKKVAGTVDEYSKRAQDDLSKEDYVAALMEWEWVLAAHPGNQQALDAIAAIKQERQTKITKLYMEAVIAMQNRDVYNAAKDWCKILKLDPDSKDAKDKLEDNKEPITTLSKDLTRQGYDEYLHGNFQNAKKYYEQALAIDPNNERTKALLKDAEDRIQK